ncbi:MAG TPA: MurR/RpiR family transcriptional regulator [Candidatus Blautia avicola]|uniref:MurR/RpiR family transcriptional regulator n=1 Tax=Candidatus Blautia avicola TaxID=2838483 RepID=A0A9D2QWB9_9FIRM|nr:MurR/RpiR family transcriptional regulator [Candidatus Blautia avicola]
MTITIPGREGKYTKSDEKILEFMESHTDEFLFMSIGEVAKRLEVSEATISRAVRHLGYRDFKEMKNEIIGQKTGKGAAGKIAGTLLKTQGFDIGKWFAMQQECLRNTLENFDQQEFSRAVSQIQSARNIYIHGKNASASSAQLLFFRLRRLGYKVFMVPSGGSEVIEGIVHAGEGDLVIIFSYSKVSAEGKMILEYAKTAGYITMAFTSRLYAPQEQRADINLYVYRGEKEEFHSMTAPAAMIDALILALSEKDQGDTARNLLKIQKLKEKFKQK